MTVRKSRIIILLVMLLFVFLPVQAKDTVVTENGYQIVIRDDAGLLSDSEEKKLIEDMRPITEYGNVAFVSGSVYSMETSTYAKQVYKELFGVQATLRRNQRHGLCHRHGKPQHMDLFPGRCL